MNYFYEKPIESKGYKLGIEITKKLATFRVCDKKNEVYETSKFGKMLVSDGMIELMEKYYFIKSEALAHFSYFSHPNPEKVLIIGDQGGVLTEIIKHKRIKEVYSVNESTLKASKNYFDFIDFKEIAEDSRIKITEENELDFISKFTSYFDLVIVCNQKDNDFYKVAIKTLSKEGILMVESFKFEEKPEMIKQDRKYLKKISKYSKIFKIDSFLGNSALILNSKKINIEELTLRTIETRFKQFKGTSKLKYYSPKIQINAMILPKMFE